MGKPHHSLQVQGYANIHLSQSNLVHVHTTKFNPSLTTSTPITVQNAKYFAELNGLTHEDINGLCANLYILGKFARHKPNLWI